MLPVSDKFLRAIRASGKRKTVINVTESFGTSYIFRDIAILDGSIQVDRNSTIRRSGSIKVGEKSLTDVFFQNHSGPFGMEIEVHSGVVYPDGTEELVQLGVFTIDEFSWQEGDGGWPIISIYDRAKWIERNDLPYARDFSGMYAQSVITTIVQESVPGASLDFEDGLPNPRLPGGSVFDGSSWGVIEACLELLAAEGYFNTEGVFVVIETKDATAIASQASYEFNVGEGFSELQAVGDGTTQIVRRPEGNLISATRSVGRAETYNAVSVYGAAPSGTLGQPYAVAFDNDPNSPTYYYGTFGKATKRIDNSLLTTTLQCSQAAISDLKNSLGLSRSISFTAVGNPALEEGDYVLFTFSDGAQEVHLLDTFEFPLGDGDFQGDTRTNPARQTTSVGIEAGRFISADGRVPSTPGKPAVTNLTETALTLTWSPSKPGPTGVPLLRYEITFNGVVIKNVSAGITSTIMSNLSPGANYTISLKAVDQDGYESEESESVTVKMKGTFTGNPPPEDEGLYAKVYTATWSSSYTGSGARASWHGNDCYQGYVEGGNGNMRSLIGFDDTRIRRELVGATITSCEVGLYYKHWYLNSGGTAIIGTHRYSDRPGSWSGGLVFENRIRSSGWDKGTWRGVNLGVGIGNEFKAGTARGIALGPGPSTNRIYYGTARGAASGSITPKLVIRYRR